MSIGLVTKALITLIINKLFGAPELLIGARLARRANVVSVRDKGFIHAVPFGVWAQPILDVSWFSRSGMEPRPYN